MLEGIPNAACANVAPLQRALVSGTLPTAACVRHFCQSSFLLTGVERGPFRMVDILGNVPECQTLYTTMY